MGDRMTFTLPAHEEGGMRACPMTATLDRVLQRRVAHGNRRDAVPGDEAGASR